MQFCGFKVDLFMYKWILSNVISTGLQSNTVKLCDNLQLFNWTAFSQYNC